MKLSSIVNIYMIDKKIISRSLIAAAMVFREKRAGFEKSILINSRYRYVPEPRELTVKSRIVWIILYNRKSKNVNFVIICLVMQIQFL